MFEHVEIKCSKQKRTSFSSDVPITSLTRKEILHGHHSLCPIAFGYSVELTQMKQNICHSLFNRLAWWLLPLYWNKYLGSPCKFRLWAWLLPYFGSILASAYRSLWAHTIRRFICDACCSSTPVVNKPPFGQHPWAPSHTAALYLWSRPLARDFLTDVPDFEDTLTGLRAGLQWFHTKTAAEGIFEFH